MINLTKIKLNSIFLFLYFNIISCKSNVCFHFIQQDKMNGVITYLGYGRQMSKTLLHIVIKDTIYMLVESDLEEKQIKVNRTKKILINNIAVGDSIYKLANNDTLLVFKKNTNKVIKIIMFK